MKKEIIKWMKEFVEVPNVKLGNWAPCPYARKARLDKQIEIVEGEVHQVRTGALVGCCNLL